MKRSLECESALGEAPGRMLKGELTTTFVGGCHPRAFVCCVYSSGSTQMEYPRERTRPSRGFWISLAREKVANDLHRRLPNHSPGQIYPGKYTPLRMSQGSKLQKNSCLQRILGSWKRFTPHVRQSSWARVEPL